MTATRKISYKGAREKGKSLERDVAKALCDIGINAKRVPMSGALSWLKGDVAELEYSGEQNVHIHECKYHETLNLPAWWAQAAAESTKGEIPALHFRSNRRDTYTVLRARDFDDLVFEYESKRSEIALELVDMPKRSYFWKVYDQAIRSVITVFLYEIKGEELVILPFRLYLKLRKGQLASSQPSTATNTTASPAVAIQ